MKIVYDQVTTSAYGVFMKRSWQDIPAAEAVRDLIQQKLEELGYTVQTIDTSGFDAIHTLEKDGETFTVYQAPNNLPPDARKVLEELDSSIIQIDADGTARVVGTETAPAEEDVGSCPRCGGPVRLLAPGWGECTVCGYV